MERGFQPLFGPDATKLGFSPIFDIQKLCIHQVYTDYTVRILAPFHVYWTIY